MKMQKMKTMINFTPTTPLESASLETLKLTEKKLLVPKPPKDIFLKMKKITNTPCKCLFSKVFFVRTVSSLP